MKLEGSLPHPLILELLDSKGKGKGKGKVHPRTGHEGPTGG
jgi:hypothetical protein